MKVERLPFDRLSGRFPATALAYATTFEELRSRYEVDYRDRRALVERARDVRNRRMEPAVIERLRARLKALDAPAAARAALAKLEGGAAAVVTGQQPGAAWGPLYNIYKAVTAIRLARGLEAEGVPSVAVFWNHSDDHHPGDLGRVRMPDSRNSPIEVTLPLADDDRPLYDRSIDPAFVDRLSAALPDTPHRAEVARVLGDAARGSLSEWFSRSMLALFGRHGLIVLEPRDLDGPRAQAVLERALREEDLVERCVAEGGEAMARLGFKPSLAGPFGTNVYAIEGGRRVRAAGRATPTETRLSAGVALRLIVQDSTLPTAAYVGGPNEVSYIGQLKELYGAYGVSMPAVVPRISATLVEHRVARVAERYDWHGADLFMGARALEQKAGTRANRDLLREVGGIQRDVEGHLRALEPEVSRIERGLVDAGRKTAGKIRRELEAFQRRIVTAQRQGDEVGRAQIEKLVNHVTPEGGLQERVYSPAYYFSMFGLSLAEVLIESLDPFAFAHQVAWLDGSGATA